MIKEMSVTEARKSLMSLPDRLMKRRETVAVTRRGKPVLAVLPWEFYESLVETLEILGDEELMAQLRQSIKEIKEGKGIPWEEAKKQLGL